MDRYVTGAVIKKLRESKKMTQEDLAERIHVSGKAVSKWETGAGFPDISLLEPLAEVLGISVIELLSGEDVRNTNRSCNMEKGRFRMDHVKHIYAYCNRHGLLRTARPR